VAGGEQHPFDTGNAVDRTVARYLVDRKLPSLGSGADPRHSLRTTRLLGGPLPGQRASKSTNVVRACLVPELDQVVDREPVTAEAPDPLAVRELEVDGPLFPPSAKRRIPK
jgi:hypothetical protein